MTLDDLKFLIRGVADPIDALTLGVIVIGLGLFVFSIYSAFHGTPAP